MAAAGNPGWTPTVPHRYAAPPWSPAVHSPPAQSDGAAAMTMETAAGASSVPASKPAPTARSHSPRHSSSWQPAPHAPTKGAHATQHAPASSGNGLQKKLCPSAPDRKTLSIPNARPPENRHDLDGMERPGHAFSPMACPIQPLRQEAKPERRPLRHARMPVSAAQSAAAGVRGGANQWRQPKCWVPLSF